MIDSYCGPLLPVFDGGRMPIIDITQPLSSSIAVWPGDRSFSFEWTARLEEGGSVNIGLVSMSTHTGTHLDAPLHYAADGHAVDAYPLEVFVGPALVLEVCDAETIRPVHIASVEEHIFQGDIAPRVLFKTQRTQYPNAWSYEFTAIHPSTIRYLALRGVVLIGTDAPSVDPADSTDLPVHHMLRRYHIANLENLALTDVEPGRYHLTALPLKLKGTDAAPVRAILMDEGPH